MGFLIAVLGWGIGVVAVVVGLVVGTTRGRRATLVVLGAGLVCTALFVAWGLASDDGQPWRVFLARYGRGNVDEVGDGPVGALLGRTLLQGVGAGLLLGYALGWLIARRGRTAERDAAPGTD